MANRVLRYGLLIALLLGLVALKAQFNPQVGRHSTDGDYYYGIARYVADGEGLLTNLSLYHQGFKTFPHRVNQSPMWPLLLGYAGRGFGLEGASMWLPELLYFLDLILLYFLTNRLWHSLTDGETRGDADAREGFLFRRDRFITPGHFAVVLLGTDRIFFTFTSLPYTEALAYFFVFATLLALDRAASRGSHPWAAFAGALGICALLTRPQMLVLAITVPLVFAWAGVAGRMSLRFALAAVIGSVAAMLPWVAFLASWMEVLSLRGVLGFADMQQTAEVVAFEHTVTAPDLASFARDRLVGLYQAFDPRSAYSYVRHMGWLVYLVPLGAFHFLLSRVRAPGSFSLALEARYVLPAAMVISGAGLLLPVHLLHMAFYKEWLFGHRQGLPIVLLVLPALVYVDAYAGRAWRYVAAAALVVSLGLNGFAVREGLKEYFKPGISPVGHELVAWLDAQSPRPAVVTAKSHKLSIFSDSGFHWTLCHSPPETTLDLLRFARAQYVLVFPSERKCNFIRGLWPEYLTRIEVFGKRGRAIWVLKPHAGALEREDWRDD